MKQKVIKFFQNLPQEKHEQFNEAFKLYRDSPNKNASVERSYNASGYTERGLDNLMYDLQKLHDISDVEKLEVRSVKLEVISEEDKELAKWNSLEPEIATLFQSFLAVPVEELNSWEKITSILGTDLESLFEIAEKAGITEVATKLELCIDFGNSPASTEANTTSTEAGDGDLKLENDDLKSENEDLQSEKEDLEFENEDLKTENENLKDEVQSLKLAPKLDATQIRVEFPFLNDKDCPDEFKILVADKISAWNRGNEIQAEIVDLEKEAEPNKEVLAKLAKEAIECFTENKKIYDELNCYQTTGKILGVHPIFKKVQLTREIETMTNDELIKYKASSAKYFSVNKTALTKAKKAKDEAKVQEIEARVAERHDKLFLVNKKLGV